MWRPGASRTEPMYVNVSGQPSELRAPPTLWPSTSIPTADLNDPPTQTP